MHLKSQIVLYSNIIDGLEQCINIKSNSFEIFLMMQISENIPNFN